MSDPSHSVAERQWPSWPELDDRSRESVLSVLDSGRLSVGWPSGGARAQERVFAEAFAAYLDVPHCVSVDHGTSALTAALEALDVGAGDEVILPALTWVACAAAVLNVGATPVLVDVESGSGCLDAQAAEDALTSRTRAILAVHLHCSMADVEALVSLSERSGVPLLEDCAQAHGACWRGRAAGTFGALGAFSMHQTKVLAGGEGGAVVTSDRGLYERVLQLRADGRGYVPGEPVAGEDELGPGAGLMGTNNCMTELSASLLLDQLPRLDEQHERRNRQATRLRERLADVPGLQPVAVPEPVTRESIYEFAIRRGPESFGGAPTQLAAEQLTRMLGFEVYQPDPLLTQSPLFTPASKRRFGFLADPSRLRAGSFPRAARFQEEVLLFHHSILLADDASIDSVGDAFERVHMGLAAVRR